MKKILCLISSTILTTSTITPIAIFASQKNQKVESYLSDSFQNLVKIINTKYTSQKILENNKSIATIIETLVPDYYKKAFNTDTKGNLRSWEMNPINDEQILWTFNDTFRNDSNYEQEYNTESYTKEITNTHTFSVGITESITNSLSISASFKIPFINTSTEVKNELTIGFNSSQEWSDSISEKVSVVAPSQRIKASPHSVLKVLYVIKQGVYNSKGIINFEVENINQKLFQIPHFYFTTDGNFQNVSWEMWSAAEIVETLREIGYINQLKNNSQQYSIITVDNINHPNKIYLNLPVSWQSQGGQIQISHYQESL